MTTQQVYIESHKHKLRVALDGETTRMTPPPHFRIPPAALHVLAPPQSDEVPAQ